MDYTANRASFLCKIKVSELETTMIMGYTAGGLNHVP